MYLLLGGLVLLHSLRSGSARLGQMHLHTSRTFPDLVTGSTVLHNCVPLTHTKPNTRRKECPAENSARACIQRRRRKRTARSFWSNGPTQTEERRDENDGTGRLTLSPSEEAFLTLYKSV
ncbi:hypothetical protein BD289DRAFT_437431 [Coniella lustricola]|uniref:Secreted protein n=1 Tax=Coniella lustricola TaxID=2025994 RepID=A0A2T3A3Y0_9PEZI|nr:hypothetical protein BD289DRAFT_437431 [Coniella lustricola]